MEKVIKINGQDVGFKCPASFPIRYHAATGRDFFADICAMGAISESDMSGLNSIVLYDLVHVMARAYDPAVPADIVAWLDSFGEFPLIEVFGKLQPLLIGSMQSSKKSKATAI